MTAYTLITGASDGLGVEFARLAARDGRNMILTARSEDKLQAVAAELSAAHDDLDIVVLPGDLSSLKGAEAVWKAATKGRQVDVLVNNAGLGYNGSFADPGGWDRELTSINVNLIAYTYLLKQAVQHMNAGDGGRVLNVASVAGFIPGPHMAVYHATKAYALSLSQAVAEEMRGTDVTVTALCPGATRTSFFDAADMHGIRLLKSSPPMKAFPVAEEGWLEARIGKRIVVPGVMNKLTVMLTRVMPRTLGTALTGFLMGKQ